MDWRAFFSALFESGQVVVPPVEPLAADDLAALEAALAPYEAAARLEAPGGAPAWDPPSGSWAAAMFYRACQFTVYRDLDAAAIAHQLSGDGPAPTPEAHYSVDLCFRFLPDLLRMARSAAEEDPLVGQLQQWATDWPLSSVGAERLDASGLRLEAIKSCPPLLQMYVDRIAAAGDKPRLEDETVRSALLQAVGAHSEIVDEALLAVPAPLTCEAPSAKQAADE